MLLTMKQKQAATKQLALNYKRARVLPLMAVQRDLWPVHSCGYFTVLEYSSDW